MVENLASVHRIPKGQGSTCSKGERGGGETQRETERETGGGTQREN